MSAIRPQIVERLLGYFLAADPDEAEVNAFILGQSVTHDEIEAAASLKRGLADHATERRELHAALGEAMRLIGPPILGSPWTLVREAVLGYLLSAQRHLEAHGDGTTP